MVENYNTALREMLRDCLDWDIESKALQEAFDQGIDFRKRQEKIE